MRPDISGAPPLKRESRPGGNGTALENKTTSGTTNTPKAPSVQPPSWRDLIKVHPAANKFDMMSEEELAALAADIDGGEDNIALRVPPVFWASRSREDFAALRPKDRAAEVYLLDGRNRLEAVWRLFDPALPQNKDIDPAERERYFLALRDSAIAGRSETAILLYGDDDPWAFVVSANVRRRHLDRDQKRDLVAELLKTRPDRSNRETAKLAQVDHKTVAAVREETERRGEIPHVSTRIDTAGRQQPAHRPPPAAVVHRSSLPPPSPSNQPLPPSKMAQIRQLRERQAQPAAAPAPGPQPTPTAVVDACFADLYRCLDEHRESVREAPLDHLVDVVLTVMGRLSVTIADLNAVEGAS
ncbi:MAG: hypothetical protein JO001_30200 [Alphaproteobacteria bacterium]|nr:hypothetical protein [Alphaproteobacteria bacterium]